MMHLTSSLLSSGCVALGMTSICMTQDSYRISLELRSIQFKAFGPWVLHALGPHALNQIHIPQLGVSLYT